MGTVTPLGNICSKSASAGRLLSAGERSSSYLNFDLVRMDMRVCILARPTDPNACAQSLPYSNTRITCHKESNINSQLISPVGVNPLLL